MFECIVCGGPSVDGAYCSPQCVDETLPDSIRDARVELMRMADEAGAARLRAQWAEWDAIDALPF